MTRGNFRELTRPLHTWTGFICGWVLFLVFLAGALTVFKEDLTRWGQGQDVHAAGPVADLDRFLEDLNRLHPDVHGEFSIALAGERNLRDRAYWLDPSAKTWVSLTPGDLMSGRKPAPEQGLGNLIDDLHHELGLGQVGSYLLGFLSLVCSLALISGLVLNLPRGFRMLAVAWRGGSRRFWGDIHGALSTLQLPSLLVFSVTGALFTLFLALMFSFDATIYRGRLVPQIDTLLGTVIPNGPTGTQARGLPVDMIRRVARAEAPGFEPVYLQFHRWGDASASVRVMGYRKGGVATFGQMSISLADGTVTEVQVPGRWDDNHAVLSTTYGLHFGDFGGTWMRGLYFLAGILGALSFLAGLVFGVEARWKAVPSKARILAKITVGVCGGTLLGLAAAIPMERLCPRIGNAAFWTALLIGVVGAWVGRLALRVRDLLIGTAVLCLTIPAFGFQCGLGLPWGGLAFGSIFLAAAYSIPPRLRGAWA